MYSFTLNGCVKTPNGISGLYFISRKAQSLLTKNSSMMLCSSRIRSAIFFVEVFPILSQIIFGGYPLKLDCL